jgi:hypothetical protein
MAQPAAAAASNTAPDATAPERCEQLMRATCSSHLAQEDTASGADSRSPAQLVSWCVQLLDSYRADRVTPSAHLEVFLREKKLISDEATASFLQEVFYGTQRFAKMLEIVIDGLYSRCRGSVVRDDRTLFVVFSFLAIHSIDEMGFDSFKSFVESQSPHKMHPFLTFLFARGDVRDSWLEEQWSLVYDIAFVRTTLIPRLERHRVAVEELIARMGVSEQDDSGGGFSLAQPPADRSAPGAHGAEKTPNFDASRSKRNAKAPTTPQPFNLTAPRPRVVPEPPIAFSTTGVKAHPVPDSLRQTSLAAIERQKEERRQLLRMETQKKHALAKRPHFHTEDRPQHLQALLEAAAAAEREARKPFHAQPPPKPAAPAVPIKLNTAAVLREEALYRRRQEREAAAIRAYEEELRDANEFETWQREMLQHDEHERRNEIERRKQEMEQLRDEVARAVAERAESNKREAALAKEEKDQRREARERQRNDEIRSARERAKQIAEQEQQARAALEEVTAEKKKLAARVTEEAKDAERRRHEAQARELEEKRRVIQEIRAMEAVAAERARAPKEVDPTATTGKGLLEEMSLVELHARLSLLRAAEESRIVQKRGLIIAEKQEKQHALLAKVRHISQLRTRSAALGEDRRDLAKQASVDRAAAVQRSQETSLVQVFDRLESKRQRKLQEARQLAEELRQRQLQKQFLEADHSKVEEIKWKSLLAGAERTTRKRQDDEQVEAQLAAETASKIGHQRARNNAVQQAAKQRFLRNYAEKVAAIQREVAKFEELEQRVKSEQVARMKAQRTAALEKLRKLNPYATAIAERELRNSKPAASLGPDAVTSRRDAGAAAAPPPAAASPTAPPPHSSSSSDAPMSHAFAEVQAQ